MLAEAVPSGGSEGESLPCLCPSFSAALDVLCLLGLQNSSLCLRLHVAFLCSSVSSPFLSLIRTLLVRFRAHPNPG